MNELRPDQPPDVPRKAQDEAPGLLDQPKRIKRWMWALGLSSLVLLLVDLLYEPHFHEEMEEGGGIDGFYGIYGFFGLIAIVLGAKLLRQLVMRPEDYYDE